MKTVALGDVAAIERNGIDPLAVPPETIYLGLEHIERGGRIIGHDTVAGAALASTKFRFTAEHVLFGKLRPNLGKVSRSDFAGVCSTDILPIRPGPGLDRDYLAHYLAQPSMVDFAASRATGANLPRLSPAVLAKFQIPLPPLDEQRRIAAILDQADALRTKRRQVLAHADALARSVFLDMFGPRGSHLEGATVSCLGEVLALKSGLFLPAKEQDGGQHPVYGGNGVNGYHSQFMFEEPKIVIGRVGAYCGAVHLTRPRSWITDNALYVSDLKQELSLIYLRDALAIANLNQFASQSGQPLISGGRIRDVRLTIPSNDAQILYERRASDIADRRSAEVRAMALDDELFASLQSRAFRGEL